MATRVAINGFGRIGRGYLRASLANPEIDIVIDHGGGLFVGGVGILKRNQFDAGFRQLGVLVIGWRRPRAGAGERRRGESGAAFRAEDRISVQVEKFRAAILALTLAA